MYLKTAKQNLERVKGIEPSSSAWKATALPLSYTRIQNFIETPHNDQKRETLAILNLQHTTNFEKMVEGAGFEPAYSGEIRFTVWRL